MILSNPEDTVHKIQLYRLLTAILDEPVLAHNICFKGGTCALMRGLLDRFSVDLDFDLKIGVDKTLIRKKCTELFPKIKLTINKQHETALMFILHYNTKDPVRNTLKLSIIDNPPRTNMCETVLLPEIDRYANVHTVETMVANKLVAPFDRFEKYGSIAGRDIYDIHYFLSHHLPYSKIIIEERRKTDSVTYLKELIAFIQTNVSQRVIEQDLNMLLQPAVFQIIRKTLKNETLMLLANELQMIKETR